MTVYKGSQKIAFIFKGSQLVYASTVPDKPYLKKPDYSNVTSLSNGTVYNTLDGDIWLNVVYNSRGNVDVAISKNSDMSNSTTIVYATIAGGVSGCKGGCILPIPKGYYFKSTNAGGLSKIGVVSNLSGNIPYKLKDKVAKLPDYTTQTPLAKNTVATPSDKPRWLYSYGSTRIVQVSKDNSTWITIATGVTSATVEPSAMFYIPAGYYVKTTGTSNTFFPCMEA